MVKKWNVFLECSRLVSFPTTYLTNKELKHSAANSLGISARKYCNRCRKRWVQFICLCYITSLFWYIPIQIFTFMSVANGGHGWMAARLKCPKRLLAARKNTHLWWVSTVWRLLRPTVKILANLQLTVNIFPLPLPEIFFTVNFFQD